MVYVFALRNSHGRKVFGLTHRQQTFFHYNHQLEHDLAWLPQSEKKDWILLAPTISEPLQTEGM